MNGTYDVIIIGAGTMGMAAGAFLSQHGLRILLLDPYAAPHDHGSHAGSTRIIRKSYYEHPAYVPLLERSYQLWKELELYTKEKIYHETGLQYYGNHSSKVINGIKLSSQLYNIPLENDNHLHHFNIPSDFQSWFEPEAGYLDVGQSFVAFNQLLNKMNCEIRPETFLSHESVSTGIKVKTDKQEYQTEKLIFTSGAFTSALLPTYQLPLKITKQNIAWIDTPDEYSATNFTCWFLHDPDKGMYYGFPVNNSIRKGLKIALHYPGEEINPYQLDNNVNVEDKANIVYFIDHYFPNLNVHHIEYQTCMYTNTPDEHFIVDYLPGTDENIVLACGFSGHGFKFAPVIGEILVKMVLHESNKLDLDFLKLNRFTP